MIQQWFKTFSESTAAKLLLLAAVLGVLYLVRGSDHSTRIDSEQSKQPAQLTAAQAEFADCLKRTLLAEMEAEGKIGGAEVAASFDLLRSGDMEKAAAFDMKVTLERRRRKEKICMLQAACFRDPMRRSSYFDSCVSKENEY